MDRQRYREEFEKRLGDGGWNNAVLARVEGRRRQLRRFRTRIASVAIAVVFAAGITDAMIDDDQDDNLYVMIDDAQTETIAGTLFE